MRLVELYGLVVPRFCFHDFLSIAGNCRMCLIEVKKSLKAIAACAMPFLVKMKIYTESLKVRFMRESVTEFILVNHPLDCPICDQGGECDLQDQVLIFGNDRGRVYKPRRSVRSKNFGNLIKTVMTRCIHCTRCVRFMKEFGGMSDLGVIGRGSGMEISIYSENFLYSSLSGNIIDLCPVGALTAKPLSFKSRSWEQVSVEVVDVFDCFGSNVVYNLRGSSVVRVLPRTSYGEYWDWITDRVRFSYDGLFVQRLLYPIYNSDKNFLSVNWFDLLNKLKNKFNQSNSLNSIIGNIASIELVNSMKELVFLNSGSLEIQQEYIETNFDLRIFYLFNFLLKDIDLKSICISLQADLKYALPIVHSRFVWKSMLGTSWFFICGGIPYYKTFVEKCSSMMGDTLEFFYGRSKICILTAQIEHNENVLIFLGEMFLNLFNILGFLKIFNVCVKMMGVYPNILRYRLGDLTTYELGVNFDVNMNYRKIQKWNLFSQFYLTTGSVSFFKEYVYYFLGTENIESDPEFSFEFKMFKSTKIYQGSTDDGALIKDCDFIFPQLSFVESRGTFLDLWGFEKYSRVVFKGGVDVLRGEVIIALVLNMLKEQKISCTFNKIFVKCLLIYIISFYNSTWISKRKGHFWFSLMNFLSISLITTDGFEKISLFFNNKGFNVDNFQLKISRSDTDISMVNFGITIFVFIFFYTGFLNNFFNISFIGKHSKNCSNLNWGSQLFCNFLSTSVDYELK